MCSFCSLKQDAGHFAFFCLDLLEEKSGENKRASLLMHNERFVAVELCCLLQNRRRRAVLNLQSTGARKSDLKRLWEIRGGKFCLTAHLPGSLLCRNPGYYLISKWSLWEYIIASQSGGRKCQILDFPSWKCCEFLSRIMNLHLASRGSLIFREVALQTVIKQLSPFLCWLICSSLPHACLSPLVSFSFPQNNI